MQNNMTVIFVCKTAQFRVLCTRDHPPQPMDNGKIERRTTTTKWHTVPTFKITTTMYVATITLLTKITK